MPKAVSFHEVDEPLKIEEVDFPKIGSNEVVLKILASSLCYSDVHVTTGVIPVKGPITLGHEICGEIEELGDNIIDFKKGDKTVVYFISPCGDCDQCVVGNSSTCNHIYDSPMYGFSTDGGFAEYMKVNAKNLVKVTGNIPPEFLANLGCAGITALHAVNFISHVNLGDTIAVYGTGGVGMYVLQLAKLSGAKTAIAIGRSEEKLQLARTCSFADETVNLTNENLSDRIKGITDGLGVDYVFDFVVSGESLNNSSKIISNNGKIILVGIGSEPVSVNPKRLTFKENCIIGSNVGTKSELKLLVDLAQKNTLKSVSNTKYRLDEANHVFNLFKDGKIRGRAFFDPTSP
ncbi:MAG TPA: alcohol dehydrogenase catalytic domain-containing protein [Nitrososphaeraceae archaeon]|nr:alcohol dehydrogenase catalytic domain-containing protein [Nitrososphaeraceae archaeon]